MSGSCVPPVSLLPFGSRAQQRHAQQGTEGKCMAPRKKKVMPTGSSKQLSLAAFNISPKSSPARPPSSSSSSSSSSHDPSSLAPPPPVLKRRRVTSPSPGAGASPTPAVSRDPTALGSFTAAAAAAASHTPTEQEENDALLLLSSSDDEPELTLAGGSPFPVTPTPAAPVDAASQASALRLAALRRAVAQKQDLDRINAAISALPTPKARDDVQRASSRVAADAILDGEAGTDIALLKAIMEHTAVHERPNYFSKFNPDRTWVTPVTVSCLTTPRFLPCTPDYPTSSTLSSTESSSGSSVVENTFGLLVQLPTVLRSPELARVILLDGMIDHLYGVDNPRPVEHMQFLCLTACLSADRRLGNKALKLISHEFSELAKVGKTPAWVLDADSFLALVRAIGFACPGAAQVGEVTPEWISAGCSAAGTASEVEGATIRHGALQALAQIFLQSLQLFRVERVASSETLGQALGVVTWVLVDKESEAMWPELVLLLISLFWRLVQATMMGGGGQGGKSPYQVAMMLIRWLGSGRVDGWEPATWPASEVRGWRTSPGRLVRLTELMAHRSGDLVVPVRSLFAWGVIYLLYGPVAGLGAPEEREDWLPAPEVREPEVVEMVESWVNQVPFPKSTDWVRVVTAFKLLLLCGVPPFLPSSPALVKLCDAMMFDINQRWKLDPDALDARKYLTTVKDTHLRHDFQARQKAGLNGGVVAAAGSGGKKSKK